MSDENPDIASKPTAKQGAFRQRDARGDRAEPLTGWGQSEPRKPEAGEVGADR